jgi:hypothetical protein
MYCIVIYIGIYSYYHDEIKEIKMNKNELTKGTEIYYHGDMANNAQFGIIAAVIEDERWGTSLEILFDDGTTTRLQPGQFSSKYLGHGGTRMVTKAAYNAWQADQMAAFAARYAKA